MKQVLYYLFIPVYHNIIKIARDNLPPEQINAKNIKRTIFNS